VRISRISRDRNRNRNPRVGFPLTEPSLPAPRRSISGLTRAPRRAAECSGDQIGIVSLNVSHPPAARATPSLRWGEGRKKERGKRAAAAIDMPRVAHFRTNKTFRRALTRVSRILRFFISADFCWPIRLDISQLVVIQTRGSSDPRSSGEERITRGAVS